MPPKRVTMSDVAQRAGVSKSTVSHVLNQTRFVAPDTKQRVAQAIIELDFRPSRIARSLAVHHSNTVGLLISDIANPFYPEVIKGVEEVALANAYNVFLANVGYDLERIVSSIHSMIDHRVDGAICMSTRFSPELVEELARSQLPAVFLDWHDPSRPSSTGFFSSLQFDFARGVTEAVQHLINLGHRRFAHISGPPDVWTARCRQETFLTALGQFGIPQQDVLVIEGNLQIEGGRAALTRILQASPRPTAIFAANDLMALGFLWEARSQGLRIPEDFSLLGLDNIPLASQITPGLSTIALPIHQIGRQAMETLLAMINNQPPTTTDPSEPALIPTELILRESTAPPPERKDNEI
ncbi:MAG: LacI family DNA-binding transcriptional regulator [Anaerolineales bacterium]|nr:LacI family DNA-binding transcriptional regulator [Anaerolineales bacterium]